MVGVGWTFILFFPVSMGMSYHPNETVLKTPIKVTPMNIIICMTKIAYSNRKLKGFFHAIITMPFYRVIIVLQWPQIQATIGTYYMPMQPRGLANRALRLFF